LLLNHPKKYSWAKKIILRYPIKVMGYINKKETIIMILFRRIILARSWAIINNTSLDMGVFAFSKQALHDF